MNPMTNLEQLEQMAQLLQPPTNQDHYLMEKEVKKYQELMKEQANRTSGNQG